MGPIYSLEDVLDMIRRRAGLILAIIVLGCLTSVWWALQQPHLYRSAEVIQIEQPKIANDLAPSTVEGSSARRLQLIEQQLMARSSLTEIIDKFGLYQDLSTLRPSEKVDRLRTAVTIAGVAAAREGFADDGTIAVLTITAEMGSAENAQLVAHEFADRTRALSAAQRQEQTRETLEFFQGQERNLIRDLRALEAEVETYRSENDLSVEGGVEFQRAEISSLNESILALDREIIAAQLARGRIDQGGRASTVAREQAEIDGQIDTLTTQRSLLNDRRDTLNATLQTTPEVERELAKFDRRLTQLQDQLEVVATRRNEAEVGFTLESASRGERLITIEEALLPDYPITMSRRNRAVLGGAASVALALLAALMLEIRRPVIRSARQMERETGLTPVVSIPEVPKRKMPRGLRKVLHDRTKAGQQGRAARLARNGPRAKS